MTRRSTPQGGRGGGVTNAGMAFAFARPTATQSDLVKQRDVVTHYGRLSYDNTGGVVDHDAPA